MVSRRRIIEANEVYLASFDPSTGSVLREGRFRLVQGNSVQSQLTGLFPPVIAINEDGRDTQPFASTVTVGDVTGGLGVRVMDAGGSLGRFWWARSNTRHKRQVTLLEKKTARENSAATDKVPRFGIGFNGATYVAFDAEVYAYQETSGTEAWGSLLHTFDGGGIPQSAPIVWADRAFWFCGTEGLTYFDGSSWTHCDEDAVAGVTVGDVLYIVSSTGLVRRTTQHAPVPADFDDVVSVGEAPSSMIVFPNQSGLHIPYVVGRRTLYAIDADAGSAAPAGPEMPPNLYAIRSTVLSSDNQAYIAQGMGVLAWDGENARPVGLDVDDGVPIEYIGGVKRLVNGNLSLFALIDNSFTALAEDESDVYSGDPYRDLAERGEGYAYLVSREGSGWHLRAISDTVVSEATMLFISDADNRYRLWFAWGGVPYTIDLQQGFFNPLEDPEGQFEETGEIIYPEMDFGYHENPKLGLLVRCRTDRCSENEVIKLYVSYDGGDAWYELRNSDGSHGITTNGSHTFFLHANPIPISTDPLEHSDEPGIGYEHDYIQIKAEFERGDDASLSPALVFVGVDVLKVQHPIIGFTVNLDMTKHHHGLSPYQQAMLLEQLIHDNAHGLLHFSYSNLTPDNSDLRTYAVKITGYQSSETSGVGHIKRKTARVTMSEVISGEH